MPSARSYTRPGASRRRTTTKVRPSCPAPRRRAPLAARPAANCEPGPSKITLPRTLHRPVLGEVNLALSHPHLAEVPPQYVRDQLAAALPSMCAALSSVKCATSTSRLAKTAEILANDPVLAATPTHMLAIHSGAPTAGGTRPVSLIPIHDVVLASHCARFPILPASSPAVSADASIVSVPIVPMRVPSPETFALLHAYLYTQQASTIRAALKTPLEAGGDILRLATHAHKIHGLWRNACVLGVVNEGLFEIIEEAWERTIAAMQACS